ncbi:uncharacterized protein LOC130941985 [Arachis stenosperma]|uniref:uncharacterized protein LOC130941985 n=1 Tax=Arachis stenosperma TaxID=217475 RepID=UPI0025AD53CC|nr:uncharacterized protein LOC130941985 [Arachis stenosperma]
MSKTLQFNAFFYHLFPLEPFILCHYFLTFTKTNQTMIKEFMKSQVMVLIVLALLLAITPLLPSSLRPTFLYFIFNVLIIALGAEAGLLSAFSKPIEDRKQPPQEAAIAEKREASSIVVINGSDVSEHEEKKHSMVVDKCVINNNSEVDKVKEYIGEADEEVMVMETEEEEFEMEEEIAGVNGQELFAKAEAFIGNFYKQLKMQREESLVY